MHALDRNLSESTEVDGLLSDLDNNRGRFGSLIEELRGGNNDEVRDFEREFAALANPSVLLGSLSTLGVGIIVTDAVGRIRWVSRLVEELTAWTASHVLGKPIEYLFQNIEVPRDEEPVSTERTTRTKLDPNCATGQLRTQSGITRSVRHTVAPSRDPAGWVTSVMIFIQDVTEVHLNTLRLEHYATRDVPTGLLNRHSFMHGLSQVFAHSRKLALLYLDVDRFNLVNDTCGHDAGDRLLQWVAAMLREALGQNDSAARTGGDEFAVLFENTTEERALSVAQELLRRFREFRFCWGDKSFTVTASVGLVLPGNEFDSPEDMLGAAERICGLAKERGRNNLQVYERDDAETARRRGAMNWVANIKSHLQHNRVCLFAQPICRIGVPKPLSQFEVLFRMIDENGLIRGPDGIIQTAEQYGLISVIDRWVLRNALRILSAQSPSFIEQLDHCSVNLSGASLRDDSMLNYIYRQFEQFAVPARKICFEITETSAVEDMAQARWFMQELGTLGCRFALDDFGSGMASYSYLRDLPVHFIKIDRAFVRDLTSSKLSHAIVGSITQIGRMLGISTIAEGVETLAIEEQLRGLGVDYVQGFYYAKPQPLADLCASVLTFPSPTIEPKGS
jgi:diguanylate cyclase (GGDEF)-like protein/PAS domain S-box-containing protein